MRSNVRTGEATARGDVVTSGLEGSLFRPVWENREGQDGRRHLHPGIIDRVLRKYARKIGVTRGYSAHSMRATFITTALDNGASLEDVQSAAGAVKTAGRAAAKTIGA